MSSLNSSSDSTSSNSSNSSNSSKSSKSNSKNTCDQFFYVLPTKNEEFFKEKIADLQAEGKLPNLEEMLDYKIFRWKPHYFTHESIVVGDNGKYFTVELLISGQTPILYAEAVDLDVKKLTYCGSIKSKGSQLLYKATRAFKSMKIYNGFFYNCQDFVNKFLSEIGLAGQTKWTDSFWGALGTGAAAGAMMLILKN